MAGSTPADALIHLGRCFGGVCPLACAGRPPSPHTSTDRPLAPALPQVNERLVTPYWFSDRSPTITAKQSLAIVEAMWVLRAPCGWLA